MRRAAPAPQRRLKRGATGEPRRSHAEQQRDGDLLGWAYAYEKATHLRGPPLLVE